MYEKIFILFFIMMTYLPIAALADDSTGVTPPIVRPAPAAAQKGYVLASGVDAVPVKKTSGSHHLKMYTPSGQPCDPPFKAHVVLGIQSMNGFPAQPPTGANGPLNQIAVYPIGTDIPDFETDHYDLRYWNEALEMKQDTATKVILPGGGQHGIAISWVLYCY